jgi:deazaflavin-dependent oxidoreductase (nitroreductase family)
MVKTPEQTSAALARELIRYGNTDRLRDDPRAVDALNRSVIEEFRANRGRVGGPLEGWPVLLLTMTGAKTGRTLVRPLCYSRDGERIVIIASYGGAPRNPPWYYNLVANPIVTVEVGAEKFKAKAAQVYGPPHSAIRRGSRAAALVHRLSEQDHARNSGPNADAHRLNSAL